MLSSCATQRDLTPTLQEPEQEILRRYGNSSMAYDIVREVRVLVDASVSTNPPIHKYSKFDRTLVVPLLDEAERLRDEVEQLRREVDNLKGGNGNGVRVDARSSSQ